MSSLKSFFRLDVQGTGTEADPYRPKFPVGIKGELREYADWSAIFYPDNPPYLYCIITIHKIHITLPPKVQERLLALPTLKVTYPSIYTKLVQSEQIIDETIPKAEGTPTDPAAESWNFDSETVGQPPSGWTIDQGSPVISSTYALSGTKSCYGGASNCRTRGGSSRTDSTTIVNLRTAMGTGGAAGVHFRTVDLNNQYQLKFQTPGGAHNYINLSKRVGGTFTDIVSTNLVWNLDQWYEFKAIIYGDNAKGFLDNVQVCPSSGWSAMGSSLSSGYTGFGVSSPTYFDDVYAEDYPATRTKNFTVGAELQSGTASYTKTLTVSASLQKNLSKTLTVNGSLLKNLSKTTTLGASLLKNQVTPFTLGSSLQATRSVPLTIGGSLQKSLSKETTVGASLQQGFSKPFTVGAELQAGVASYTKTLTVGASLQQSLSVPLTVGGSLQKNLAKETTVGASLQKSLSKSLTVGAELQLSTAKDFTLNASLQKSLSKTLTVGADLKIVPLKTLTLNASLLQNLPKPLSVGASLSKSLSKTLTLAAELKITPTLPVTLNASLLKSLSKGFSVGAELKPSGLKIKIAITETSPAITKVQHNIRMHSTRKAPIRIGAEETRPAA